MSTEDELLKSQNNGTGHILQDLLSSTTVLLKGSNFFSPAANCPVKTEQNNASPEELRSCCICSESGTNLSPLALLEMEILTKFVLNQEQISLILQTEDHPAIFCCKICSSVIHSLAKLSTQIESITISLRAVISSRNGLFCKLRKNESVKISEFSDEVATQIFNKDDDQQLTGFVEEEELFIKVEPTHDDDDEITSDPLYESEMSESEDDSDDGNSNEEGFVCKICSPNVTLSSSICFIRHMKNKKIHPDISEAQISDLQVNLRKLVCRMCKMKFTRNQDLHRHLRNKRFHPDLSEADIDAAAGADRLAAQKKNSFSCPKCKKGFSSQYAVDRHKRLLHDRVTTTRKCPQCPQVFTYYYKLQRHMRKCHSIRTNSSSQEASYSCAMCAKTFATLRNRQRHVELLHFRDKTSCPYGCVTTKFGSEADWVAHLEGCDSPKMSEESQIVCQYCRAVFRNSLLEMEHFFREHTEKSSPCSVCGGKFTTLNILHSHRCTPKRKKIC